MPKAIPPSLFDMPTAATNAPEFGVAELSNLVKRTVEETFGQVRVRGEISDCKLHSSGHLYLTLKEGTAVLASVCWKGSVSKLSLRPEVGMEVVCTGRLTTFQGQSKYQMVIEQMTLAGVGALLKMLEERKKKLAAEGLFDLSRKRSLPFLPRIIGVVTSPTGAVIRDILHRLDDRFPRHVLVWAVAVQGESAAGQITAAVHGFNAMKENQPDLLIIARGGGSVEDLMPFNEESVVRAVADSKIPIISAVGHETDTTLIDFAADLRAPTPTAAAEKAVPVRADLLGQIMNDGTRLLQCMSRGIADRWERVGLTSRALGDPARAVEPLAQRLDMQADNLSRVWLSRHQRRVSLVAEAAARLRHPRDLLNLATHRYETIHGKILTVWRETFTRKSNRLETLGSVLGHLSPRAVLGRGYALVQDEDGHVIASAAQAKSGALIHIEFNDGKADAFIK